MENEVKTTLDIIQELIAIHATRKEVADKLIPHAGSEAHALEAARIQSDEFISQLMSELSNFGDAVQDSPNRDNEYQLYWKQSQTGIDTLQGGEATGIFAGMEDILKNIYAEIMATKDLPESLVQIISSQKEAIK